MTPEQFKVIFEARLEKIRQKEIIKGKQYSRHGDRFSHFKDTAADENITPERALMDMWKKHITYTKYIIEDIENGMSPSEEHLDEVTGDMMIYPVLLEGLIRERIEIAQDGEETKS